MCRAIVALSTVVSRVGVAVGAEPETPAFESLVQLYIRGEPYVCLPASEAQIDAALSPEARRSRN